MKSTPHLPFFSSASLASRKVLFASSACLFALCAATVGCEPPPISELSADQGIQRIRERHGEAGWDKVVSDVNEFRSRFPYTQFAAEAELLQADAYFQSDRYPEAVVAYEDFLRKQPSHGNADLAYFRVARSYDLQSPEEIDREQANALKAIEKYGLFLERFQGSPLGSEAKARVTALRRRAADHYAFIARFYWKKDLYQGALTRYLAILRDYAVYDDLRAEASTRAARCYDELASELEADPKSDMSLYFKNETPASLRLAMAAPTSRFLRRTWRVTRSASTICATAPAPILQEPKASVSNHISARSSRGFG